jgi:hypothetical protein
MVDRTTRHTAPDRARTDGAYAVHARSVAVCLDNDGPFIDVEVAIMVRLRITVRLKPDTTYY